MQFLAVSGIFFNSYAQSDFFGKCIFLALFFLSFICWWVLIQKTIVLHRIKKFANSTQTILQQNQKNILHLPKDTFPKRLEKDTPNPFSFLYGAVKEKTFQALDKNRYFKEEKQPPAVFLSRSDIELVDAHAHSTLHAQTKFLEKNLFILAMIVSLAPFLGILGTVWGILVSLFEMQSSHHSNAIIMSGISTALATTVIGLVIAIPALISYNYLKNTIRNLQGDMTDFCNLLLSTVELQYRKVDVE